MDLIKSFNLEKKIENYYEKFDSVELILNKLLGGLENLKKVHFNAIIELKNTK